MTTEQDLFAAIVATPDDDGPRLVYADWLEEHGDSERCEFIRAQCTWPTLPELVDVSERVEMRELMLEGEKKLAGLKGYVSSKSMFDMANQCYHIIGKKKNPHRQALQDRAEELLNEYRSKWFETDAYFRFDIERGFPAKLYCTKDVFFGRDGPSRQKRACSVCRGTQEMRVYIAPPVSYRFRETRHINPYDRMHNEVKSMPCWHCGGLGFRGGVFLGLESATKDPRMNWPLTAIELTDRMPRTPQENYYEPEAREWECVTDDGQENHFIIPRRAFDYMPVCNRIRRNQRNWWLGQQVVNMPYRSEEDAMKALSDVCVAWYRQKRGIRHVLKHYRHQLADKPY